MVEYNKLNIYKEVLAEDCIIKEIDTDESNNFLNENHLEGSCTSTVSLGLYFDNMLVSIMLIQNYAKDKWEIIRFANKLNYNIDDSISKVLMFDNDGGAFSLYL